MIRIMPNVIDYADDDHQRYWCLGQAPDGRPCPHTTTKFHLRWNSHLCDYHIDLHNMPGMYKP